MKVNIRYVPQYNKGEIVRYLVYAWVGNPLLGKVVGSERHCKTKYEAHKTARLMREQMGAR